LNGDGKEWTEIPFTFVGANNNDARVDPSPMYDMAELNVAHYQTTADCRKSAYFTGQVQVAITGLTENWRDHLEKNRVYFGSETPILLPEGGDIKMVQSQGNTQAEREREYVEKQMIAIGARLIQPGSAPKTATESQ